MTSTVNHQQGLGSRSWIWDGIRTTLAGIYILGGISHLVLALISPDLYESFANQALVGAYTKIWNTYIVPHLSVLVPLIGVFELSIGGALLAQDRTPRLAHGSGAAFQAGLILSGPWGPINALLAVVHIVGSRQPYPESIPTRIRRWKAK